MKVRLLSIIRNLNIKFAFKRHIYKYIFFIFSFIIFILLFLDPQKVVYDARGYYNLGLKIYQNGFDVIDIDLINRTYVFPLLISGLIFLSKLFKLNSLNTIYIVNYIFFVFSIYLIYRVLYRKNGMVGNLFLLINSINIINLSFVNTVLTESFMILPIAILFYLFSLKKYSRLRIFLIGFISALTVMIRPSNLFLFLMITIFVLFQIRKKIEYLFWYLIPILLIFSISFLNVYKQENKLSLFTTTTNGIYDMQIKAGTKYFKYETSVATNLKSPAIYYVNKQTEELILEKCTGTINCFISYFINNPIKYSLILAVHSFTLFDRNFIDLYVENMFKTDILLIIYNYIVISSVICFFIFYLKKYFDKYKDIFFNIFLLIFGTLLIYIPTVIEARFSSPIFPLLTIFSAMFFYSLFRDKKENKVKIICCQLLIIFIFSIISYLVSQTMVLN